MKHFGINLIFVLLFAFGLISCEYAGTDDTENNEEDILPVKNYEVLTDQTYKLYHYVTGLLNLDESFIDYSSFGTMISAQLNTCINKLKSKYGFTDEEIGFRKVTYTYESIDQYGNDVDLSSLVFWLGYFDDGEWYDLAPENICLMEHYTITADDECPTKGNPLEPLTLGNRLVVMPDYIGYGATEDMIHPYLNHDLCALNSIDALTAGYSAYKEMTSVQLVDGWCLEVMGASQGGGNALAVHKYIETRPEFAETWNFAGSYCAAGPYVPALTVDKYLEAGVTDSPVLFVLTIKAMYDSYPEILGKFDVESMYSDKYLEIMDKVEEMVDSKSYSTTQLNNHIIRNISTGGSQVAISDILSADMLDKDSDICSAFYECLHKNDLVVGWKPSKPVRLYYSEIDKTVPFDNAIAVRDAFGEDVVTLDKGPSFSHSISCAMWMLKLLGESYVE